MKPKPKLDMDKIAGVLGAERKGTVGAAGGYFGATLIVAEIQARFRTPAGGGRSTDPSWTERRLVPFTQATLARLEEIAEAVHERGGPLIAPLQVAALLLERAAAASDHQTIEELLTREASGPPPKRRPSRSRPSSA